MASCICSGICFIFLYLLLLNQIRGGGSPLNGGWGWWCGESCGSLQIPFPFYLNASSYNHYICGGLSVERVSDAFGLSCLLQQQQQQNTSASQLEELVLYLKIGSQSYRILQFFPDGVLLDYYYLANTKTVVTSSSSSTSTPSCTTTKVVDLEAFGFDENNNNNNYFGLSADNIVGLYNCHDSSLCKSPHCVMEEEEDACNGTGQRACCYYPLSDMRRRYGGKLGFSMFSRFGCKGFSCWVLVPSSTSTSNNSTRKHGLKLEWAIPRNSSKSKCSPNAYSVNATSVPSAVRCQCSHGFVGDAFAHGLGCFRTCLKDGREARGKDCFTKKNDNNTWKIQLLTGVVASGLSLASLAALFYLLKRNTTDKSNASTPDKDYHIEGTNASFANGNALKKTRLFDYNELEEATKGFDDSQKLVEGTKGTLYAGVLKDGSQVAVHKFQHYLIEEEERVLQLVEGLSAVPHRNLARVLGCSIGKPPPLVVYEYPANGSTLGEYLLRNDNDYGRGGLKWYKRLEFASQTAGLLAFLQYEIRPQIFHHDLHPGFIFLDHDFSVKIAGFATSTSSGNYLDDNPEGGGGGGSSVLQQQQFCTNDDVYGMGMILVDIIAGIGEKRLPPTTALRKIRSGKLEEIADPLIYYDELHREELDVVADLATRCLLFGDKLGMLNVARELSQLLLLKQTTSASSTRRAAALDETFSNSSLLQMISMSPDSVYVTNFSVV